jgi:hypothetical protein
VTKDELRKNDRRRDKIDQMLEQHPDLRDVTEVIAFRRNLYVPVGTPFLERVRRTPRAG